jgi:hypothetical protein
LFTVVRADPETSFFAPQGPRASNLDSFARDLLIYDRLPVPALRLTQHDEEVALFVEPHLVGAVETQPDSLRIRRGRYDPVVFQVSVLSIVNKVYAGIDTKVPGFSIVRNRGVPLAWVVANKVIARGVLLALAHEMGAAMLAPSNFIRNCAC